MSGKVDERVAIIIPNSPYLADARVFPSLGSLAVAAELKRHDIPVEVLDLNGISNSAEVTREYCAKTDAGIFAIGGTSPQLPQMREIIETIRQYRPEARVILGGPHVTLTYSDYKREKKTGVVNGRAERAFRVIDNLADILIAGDGQTGIMEAIQSHAPHIIDGDDPNSPFWIPEEKMGDYLWPDRSLVDLGSYRFSINGVRSTHLVSMLACPYACNFCNYPDNVILTDEGAFPIWQVVDQGVGNKVFTGESWQRIKSRFKRETQEDLVRIKARGIPAILLTKNHEVATQRGWIQAGELISTDSISVPFLPEKDIEVIDLADALATVQWGQRLQVHKKAKASKVEVETLLAAGNSDLHISSVLGINRKTVSKIRLGEYREEQNFSIDTKLEVSDNEVRLTGSKNSAKRFFVLNDDFCELAGLYISQGCVHLQKNRPNSATVSFTFNRNKPHLIQRTCELIHKVFDIYPVLSDTKTAIQVSFNRGLYGYLLIQLFGKGAKNKHIPMEWLSLPIEKLKALIKGYMVGDGYRMWFEKSGHYGYKLSTISYTLAWQMAHLGLLFHFGLYFGQKKNVPNVIEGRKVNVNPAYEVGWSGKNALLAFESGDEIVRAENRLFPLTSLSQEEYSGPVYNLEVENQPWYTANLTQVHNCGGRLSPFFRRTRKRPISDIIGEMRHIYKTYGITGFMDASDELNLPNNFVEYMNAITDLQNELGVSFTMRAFAKANLLTEAQAEAMARAGLKHLLIGFESGSERILTNIQKKSTKAQNTEAVRICRKYGISLKFLMSLGHAGEDLSTIKETHQWLLDMEPSELDCTIITAYPSTPYYSFSVPHPTEKDVWVYRAKNGDILYSYDVPFEKENAFYKGVPGEYTSLVWTPSLGREDLVELRNWLEDDVRSKIGIPYPRITPNQHFEASMGMLPGFIYRSSQPN